ncbi:MAG: hypothetical protein ABI566_00740 [Pseudolysinimonas sp.]
MSGYWTRTSGTPKDPARPRRFAGPVWRIAGAIAAWLLFSFCFTVLYQAAAVLSGIGGYCASGGPYVISTQCPAVLDWAFPVGFLGGFLAWVIGAVFQRGFAAPLVVWAWPILFVGLGIEFFVGIPNSGAFVGILCGTLFVVMGLAPLLFEFRGGPARLFLGRTNVLEVPFTSPKKARRTFYGGIDPDDTATVAATPGDWALSLFISIGSLVGGYLLGTAVFA